MNTAANIFKYPLVSAAGVFLLILALTQYLAYQEFRFARDKELEVLNEEGRDAKDRLRNILYTDISIANTLAILYKEDVVQGSFDSIAARLISNSRFVETIVLVQGTVISKVYPLNKDTRILMGADIMRDSVVKNEAMKAVARQGVYFSGPRKLKIGGEGIWGEVPIIAHGKVIGFVGVLTRLTTLQKALDINPSGQGKFAYVLKKANSKDDSTEYLLSVAQPGENAGSASVAIPEGDWILKVVYSKNYTTTPFSYRLYILCFFLSLIAGLFAYRRFNEPVILKKIIDTKTKEANERVKEITTLYKVNGILQDVNQEAAEVFRQIVNLIPFGWQYVEVCAAKIVFDGHTYTTPGYKLSSVKQEIGFELIDGRTGSIEVIYTQEMPPAFDGPFLKEERDLLAAIAEIIKIYFNKAIQQRSLAESEAKFRGAFENSATGMGLVSIEGRWQSVNKGLCEMVGYTEEELLKLTFQELTHKDDLPQDLAFRDKALKGEADYYQTEKRYIHKKGFIVWVNVNIALIKAGSKAVYFVVQIENITGRIESQLKFKNLVEKSPVGVYIIQNNRFVYVNPALIQKSGYSEQELLNMPLSEFIHKDDFAEVAENIKRRLTQQQDETRYQIRVHTKNRQLLWTEVHGAATLYEGLPAVIGTMVDVSLRVQMELEQEKILNDLIERNRDLEQFSFIVSHNIRSPLATLLGLRNLLSMDLPEAEQATVIAGMGEYADKLDEVVKDVTEILNVRKDLLHQKTKVNLDELVKSVLADLMNMISSSRAIITRQFTEADAVDAIPAHMHSIFLNLIKNGIQFAQPGVPAQIHLWSERKDGKINICFRDNGIGIDLQQHKHNLFGLYKKIDHTAAGKGMGLFMVKTQMNAMNGTVDVHSEPGKGSTFMLSFPV